MGVVQPAAYKALFGLNQYILQTEINPLHHELIRIRASQMNGCAYCVHEHTRDALKLGETPQRIFLISVWREAGDIFSADEQLLFRLTEAITEIRFQGLSDALYTAAIDLFGEVKTAQVIMAITTINAWNRIGVALSMQPSL